jgi:hypothetical protein
MNNRGKIGASPIKKPANSPPKSKFGDSDEDDDGVKGFTLRLTQV